MDVTKVIREIIAREGGFVNDGNDKGGPTKFGITLATLADWRKKSVGIEDVRLLTQPEAEDIYWHRYVKGPGFDRIPDPALAAQLTDFGVNSGPMLAIQKLQTIIDAEVDGVLGNETLQKLSLKDPRVVNNQLVAERVKMLGRIVIRSKNQIAFLGGWLDRALSFLR